MKSSINKTVWEKWKKFGEDDAGAGFFLQLLTAAQESSPAYFQNLQDAAISGDAGKVQYFSHTLASTCRTLGAEILAAQLKEIENSARGTPPEIRVDLLPSAKEFFEEFLTEIRKELDLLKIL